MNSLDKTVVQERLKTVIDPELGINIVDLGLIYEVAADESGNLKITMTLTTPGCPLHDSIVGGVKSSLTDVEGVASVDVNVVWSPPWTPDRMSEEAARMLHG
ncbi:metal-sulfur cluster assembly factor [Bacillus marinisedimentorum]|uniref:metal-sulfur cluster assembly factor n=1 Tax=Bacillus marinisedimentorum TaxID=1821260 RepID=UPI000872EEE2|nr:metal-sulfur cluster assembly factor [Bacillus marinisedimentorum]